MKGDSICSRCRHSARGHAIDMRPKVTARRGPGQPPAPNSIRPSLQGGDFICAREGLTRAARDPVTGFEPLPSGPDCRDLNPDGRCQHYQRGCLPSDVFVGAVVASILLVLAAIVGGL